MSPPPTIVNALLSRQRTHHRQRSRRERRGFGGPHRAVPYDRLRIPKRFAEQGTRRGPDVERHHPVGNFPRRNGPGRRGRLEPLGHDHVDRQIEPDLLLRRPGENTLRRIHHLGLVERFPHTVALRRQEGVRHRAADQDLVDLAEDVVDRIDFPGDLRPAEDRRQRTGGGDERFLEIGDLVLHQEARRALLHVLDDGHVGGVRPMRRGEGVVDVDVAEGGEPLAQLLVVLLLPRLEAHVLEEQDVPGHHRGYGHRSRLAHAILRERDRPSEQPGQARRDRSQAHLRDPFPLRAAKVGDQDRLRAPLDRQADRGKRRLEPRVVRHVPGLVHRHVEVDADERPLAGQVQLVDRADLHFGKPPWPNGWGVPSEFYQITVGAG